MRRDSFQIRQAEPQDLPQIIALDQTIFGPLGTDEAPEIIRARQAVFPQGFFILEAEGQFAGYACAEKWTERGEPALNTDPRSSHDPQGPVFCITTLHLRRLFSNGV